MLLPYKAFFWSDSSTRFEENPYYFGLRGQQDGVMFGGRTSVLGMAENTHPDTYRFMNKSLEEYYTFKEVAATQWMAYVHPRDDRSFYTTLQRWISCGSMEHCRACMGPSLDTKSRQSPLLGPPNKKFVVPRQDQSVLGLLVYEQIIMNNNEKKEKEETTTVVPHHGKAVDLSNNKRYMNITTARENRAEQISDINGPI